MGNRQDRIESVLDAVNALSGHVNALEQAADDIRCKLEALSSEFDSDDEQESAAEAAETVFGAIMEAFYSGERALQLAENATDRLPTDRGPLAPCDDLHTRGWASR